MLLTWFGCHETRVQNSGRAIHSWMKRRIERDSSGFMPSMCVVKVGEVKRPRRPVRGWTETQGWSTSLSRMGMCSRKRCSGGGEGGEESEGGGRRMRGERGVCERR